MIRRFNREDMPTGTVILVQIKPTLYSSCDVLSLRQISTGATSTCQIQKVT